MSRLRLILPLVCALALLAGCDDEDPPEAGRGSGGSAPPAAGFAAAADELCANAQAAQEDIRREVGGVQLTLDDRARLLTALAPVRLRLAEDLAVLEPVPGGARATGRLVAAARRRGEASERAGALRASGAAQRRVAAAAASEHDERLRFVALAERLGLVDCAERLSAGALAAIERTVTVALTEPDPGRRCAAYGSRFLAQEYGSRGRCRRGAPTVPLVEAVEVEGAVGIDDVFAVARVRAGSARYRVRLTYEDGAYRVDKLD